MSMQGWRIEVREDIAGYRTWSPDMTDPNGPTLTVYWFLLHPTRVSSKAFERVEVAACAWPLRDTIYVSRPVTDAEADTLRELLDSEMRREREARGIHYRDGSAPLVMWTAPLKSFAISAGVERIDAGQAVTLAPDGTVRPIDAGRHRGASGYYPCKADSLVQRINDAVASQAERAVPQCSPGWEPPVLSSYERQYINGIHCIEWRCMCCHQLARAPSTLHVEAVGKKRKRTMVQCPQCHADHVIDPLLRPQPLAVPRVPQVGDEIEVLSNSWHHAEVTAVGGGETFRADWVNADGDPCALWVSFARTDRWRWPEAERAGPKPGDEIEVRDRDEWRAYRVAQVALGRDVYVQGMHVADLAARYIVCEIGTLTNSGLPLRFALPVSSPHWRRR